MKLIDRFTVILAFACLVTMFVFIPMSCGWVSGSGNHEKQVKHSIVFGVISILVLHRNCLFETTYDIKGTEEQN